MISRHAVADLPCTGNYGFILFFIILFMRLWGGGDHAIQYHQVAALLRLEQPLHPSMTIPGESQEKLPLVASMREMPDMPRNIMAMCSCHEIFLYAPFSYQKEGHGSEIGPSEGIIPFLFGCLSWCDPNSQFRGR